MKTPQAMRDRITYLKTVMERSEKVFSKPFDENFDAPGGYITGGSNRSKSLDRMVDQRNNRNSQAFARYQWAKGEIRHLEVILTGYEAGECHLDGRPRKDAPSRTKNAAALDVYAAFIRATVKPGDQMALVYNHGLITVKRLNAKTVTQDNGEKWEYKEVLPVDAAGTVLTGEAFKVAMSAWRKSQGL